MSSELGTAQPQLVSKFLFVLVVVVVAVAIAVVWVVVGVLTISFIFIRSTVHFIFSLYAY